MPGTTRVLWIRSDDSACPQGGRSKLDGMYGGELGDGDARAHPARHTRDHTSHVHAHTLAHTMWPCCCLLLACCLLLRCLVFLSSCGSVALFLCVAVSLKAFRWCTIPSALGARHQILHSFAYTPRLAELGLCSRRPETPTQILDAPRAAQTAQRRRRLLLSGRQYRVLPPRRAPLLYVRLGRRAWAWCHNAMREQSCAPHRPMPRCAAFRTGAQALRRRRDPRAHPSRASHRYASAVPHGVLAARCGVAKGEDDNGYSRLRLGH